MTYKFPDVPPRCDAHGRSVLGRVPPTRNAWSAEMPEQLHVKRTPPSAAVALRYASNASMQPSIDGSAT